ncbi:pyrroloquinoline quinone precursor peptide PqqA [Actinomycetospora sp. NBC_00405]
MNPRGDARSGTPEFEEIGVAPEVTMYVARMDD